MVHQFQMPLLKNKDVIIWNKLNIMLLFVQVVQVPLIKQMLALLLLLVIQLSILRIRISRLEKVQVVNLLLS